MGLRLTQAQDTFHFILGHKKHQLYLTYDFLSFKCLDKGSLILKRFDLQDNLHK